MKRKPPALEEFARQIPAPPLPEDVWDRIDRRMDEPLRVYKPKRIPSTYRYAIAACIACVLTMGGYMAFLQSPDQEVVFDEEAAFLVESADDDLDMAIMYYERAIQKLERAGAHPPEEMPSDLAEVYQEKITGLKSSIAECKEALRYNSRHRTVRTALYTSYMELEQTLKDMHEIKEFNRDEEYGS